MGMAEMLLACTEVLDTKFQKAAKLSDNVSNRGCSSFTGATGNWNIVASRA